MFDISGSFGVRKCRRCGLVFRSSTITKILEKHYPRQQYYSYKGSIKGLSGLIRRFRSYLIKNYYEPTILSGTFSLLIHDVPGIPKKPDKKPWKVLDVGCGSGDIDGFERIRMGCVRTRNRQKCNQTCTKERGLVNIKLGGYEKIENFPNNYFNCIRLYHVIEHLPNPYRCLQLIYKN